VGERETALAEREEGRDDAQAPRRDDLSTLERAIEHCLLFCTRSEAEDEFRGWYFQARRANMTVRVSFNSGKGTVSFEVIDNIAGEAVELWSSEVRISGDKWRIRLRQAAGVSISLAQHRPWCSTCRGDMKLRRRGSDQVQFFGCMKFPECRSTLGLVAHDIERPA
jgi:hypothetical protein